MDPIVGSNNNDAVDDGDSLQPKQKKIKLPNYLDEYTKAELRNAIDEMKNALLDYLNADGTSASGIDGERINPYAKCVHVLEREIDLVNGNHLKKLVLDLVYEETFDLLKLMRDDCPSSFGKRQRLVTIMAEILPKLDPDEFSFSWDEWDDRCEMLISYLLNDFLMQRLDSEELTKHGVDLVAQVVNGFYDRSDSYILNGVFDVERWMDANKQNSNAVAAGLMILCSCPLCVKDEGADGLRNYVEPVIDIIVQGKGLLEDEKVVELLLKFFIHEYEQRGLGNPFDEDQDYSLLCNTFVNTGFSSTLISLANHFDGCDSKIPQLVDDIIPRLLRASLWKMHDLRRMYLMVRLFPPYGVLDDGYEGHPLVVAGGTKDGREGFQNDGMVEFFTNCLNLANFIEPSQATFLEDVSIGGMLGMIYSFFPLMQSAARGKLVSSLPRILNSLSRYSFSPNRGCLCNGFHEYSISLWGLLCTMLEGDSESKTVTKVLVRHQDTVVLQMLLNTNPESKVSLDRCLQVLRSSLEATHWDAPIWRAINTLRRTSRIISLNGVTFFREIVRSSPDAALLSKKDGVESITPIQALILSNKRIPPSIITAFCDEVPACLSQTYKGLPVALLWASSTYGHVYDSDDKLDSIYRLLRQDPSAWMK